MNQLLATDTHGAISRRLAQEDRRYESGKMAVTWREVARSAGSPKRSPPSLAYGTTAEQGRATSLPEFESQLPRIGPEDSRMSLFLKEKYETSRVHSSTVATVELHDLTKGRILAVPESK